MALFDQPYLRCPGGLLGVGFAVETLQVKSLPAADIVRGDPLFHELVLETPGFAPERGLRGRLQAACLERAFELIAGGYAPVIGATLSFGTIECRFDQVMAILGDNADLCGHLALILRGDLKRMRQPHLLRHVGRAAHDYGAMVLFRGPLQGSEGLREFAAPDIVTVDALPDASPSAWRQLAGWIQRRGLAQDAVLLQGLDDAARYLAAREAGFVYAQGDAVGAAREAPRLEAFAPPRRARQRRRLAA
jgi:hypothetical protein